MERIDTHIIVNSTSPENVAIVTDGAKFTGHITPGYIRHTWTVSTSIDMFAIDRDTNHKVSRFTGPKIELYSEGPLTFETDKYYWTYKPENAVPNTRTCTRDSRIKVSSPCPIIANGEHFAEMIQIYVNGNANLMIHYNT